MPFEMVNGSVEGWVYLDRGADRRREGAVLVMNLERSIVTIGDFATRRSQITLGRTCYNYEDQSLAQTSNYRLHS